MAIVNKPNTFSGNTTISSSEVNSNFDTLYNEFNGSISSANLVDDAVTAAKLADNAVVTANISSDAVTATKIADDAVTAAKLAKGMIKNRRGGTSGDASWGSNGTTNTDTSAKAVFFQCGSCAVTSVDMLVSFPESYTYPPIVVATTNSAGSSNAFAIVNGVSTTGFNIRTITDGGSGSTTEGVYWLAMGQ